MHVDAFAGELCPTHGIASRTAKLSLAILFMFYHTEGVVQQMKEGTGNVVQSNCDAEHTGNILTRRPQTVLERVAAAYLVIRTSYLPVRLPQLLDA